MEINPAIIKILEQYNIDVDSGLLVLLGLYYKLDVDKVCPEEAVKAINISQIVYKDYKLNIIGWNIPLFIDSGQPSNWDWVIGFVEQFKKRNPDRAGSWRDCIKRMQKFFADYPEYRKEDVIAATKLYFSKVKDPQYLMKSHKFISDGIGSDRKSTLLEYCEKVVEARGKDNTKGRPEGLKGSVS